MSDGGDTTKGPPPGWVRECNASAVDAWLWLLGKLGGAVWWLVRFIATMLLVSLLMILQPLLLLAGAALVLGIVFRTDDTLALLALLPGYAWITACFLWENAGTLAAGITAERVWLVASQTAGAARMLWASIQKESK